MLFEFNQIYRQIESSLTEAAQFTALLEARPTVTDPASPQAPSRRSAAVALDRVDFGYPGQPDRSSAGSTWPWRTVRSSASSAVPVAARRR